MLWIVAIISILTVLGVSAYLRGSDTTEQLSTAEAELARYGVVWER